MAIDTICATAALAAVIGPAGFYLGLLKFDPNPLPEAALDALVAFLVPALAEELVFRGPIPSRGETKRPMVWVLGSTLLFVLWHGLEGLIFPGAQALLRGDFLAISGALGLACAYLRHRSGSLWPAVVLHWVIATAWLTLFGGPSIRQLTG